MRLNSHQGYLKELWDLLIVLLTIFIAIELPLRLALDYSFDYSYIEVLITVILVLDIIVNFTRKTYSNGITIKNRKKITRHYLRRSFIFDLLATLPFFLFYLLFPGLVILKWMSIFRLFKLLRLTSLISKWRRHQTINPSILRLAFFFFWIVLIAHWIACIWIFIARYEGLDTIPSYIDAIYWCITTITTVGYGDISPVTDLQKILTMIAMFLGVAVYGFVIGNVASLLSNIDSTKASFLKQMEDINSYLSYKSVPRRLRHKVNDYYHYIWNNRMLQSEKGLVSNLPESLRAEISLHIHKRLIDRVPFFKNTDKDFISEIILMLKAKVYLPEDYVFRKGDVGNCMYFISSGSVNVFSDDESSVLVTLKEGDYFGEIALIKQVTRTRSVKTNNYCYLYALEKNSFDTLLKRYPAFKKHIYETIEMREKQAYKNNIQA
jgi:hypothetical protein